MNSSLLSASMQKNENTMKLKVSPRRLLKSTVFWTVLLVVQVIFLYGITWYGYRSSLLPYWFDNAVQSSGMWRIYGVKTYEMNNGDQASIIDPRIENVVDETVARYSIRGYLSDYYEDEEMMSDIVLEIPNAAPFHLDGEYYVDEVLRNECVGADVCEERVYVQGSLEDVTRDQLVEITFVRSDLESEWSIDQLLIADEYSG